MSTRDDLAAALYDVIGGPWMSGAPEWSEFADRLIRAGWRKVDDAADKMAALLAHKDKELERRAGHIVALQTQANLAESRAAHAEKQVSRLQWYASRGKVGMDASPDTEPSS